MAEKPTSPDKDEKFLGVVRHFLTTSKDEADKPKPSKTAGKRQRRQKAGSSK